MDASLDVDVEQVKQMLDQNQQFLLLDCREPSELAVAKIEGSLHIPMRETIERQDELQEYRDQPIVVYCHHGGRSARVTHWLRANGFPQAQNMAGGIDWWSQTIDPDIPRY